MSTVHSCQEIRERATQIAKRRVCARVLCARRIGGENCRRPWTRHLIERSRRFTSRPSCIGRHDGRRNITGRDQNEANVPLAPADTGRRRRRKASPPRLSRGLKGARHAAWGLARRRFYAGPEYTQVVLQSDSSNAATFEEGLSDKCSFLNFRSSSLTAPPYFVPSRPAPRGPLA